MNNLLDTIKSRRSIRKYLDVPLDWATIAEILEAARNAPSSGNMQNTCFLVVVNDKKRNELAEAAYNQEWMKIAPVHIIVCSDDKHLGDAYGERGKKLYAIQNCAAAIENMLIAATALGIGSCWVGAFNDVAVQRIVKLPKNIKPQAIITLGYSDDRSPQLKKDSLESLTHFEEWGKKERDTTLWPLYKHRKKVEKIAKKATKKTKLSALFKKIKKK